MAIGEELGSPEAIAYAGLGLRTFAISGEGPAEENRSKQSAALRERVVSLSRKLPDVWVRTQILNCRWSDALFYGRFTEGHELWLKLFELSRSSGDPRPMGFGYWQTALNDLTRDQPAEALKNARNQCELVSRQLIIYLRVLQKEVLWLSWVAPKKP